MLEQRLGRPVRLAYGLGLAAEGIKNGAFNIFLLFFYQQIVHLDPALCGLALFLSLCADAVLDPLIGAWSDSFESKLGRRHPFLYSAILPLGVCYLLAFVPPSGLAQWGKFFWLLTFAIGTRVAMAMFVIPHQSLIPELTQDSGERAALTTLRTVFAWMFGLLSSLLGYTVFLRSTPAYPQGLLNPHGYLPFAVFGSVTMMAATAVSALGTQRVARDASQRVAHTGHLTLRELPAAMRQALTGESYRAVVFAGLFLFVGFGLNENLNNYMNTFFWGFTSQQIGAFVVVIFLASLAVLASAKKLLLRYGSRNVGMGAALVTGVLSPLLIGLRLLGLMPRVGEPALFTVLAIGAFFIYASIILGMTVVGKMIADATDEHELTTGKRQEGLLFSASMFMTKSASGLGTLFSGLIIKATHIPEGATLETVDPLAIYHLGLGSAIGSLLLGAVTCYFFARYTLSASKHQSLVGELIERRAARVQGREPG